MGVLEGDAIEGFGSRPRTAEGCFGMKSSNVDKPRRNSGSTEHRKSYIAPTVKCLTPPEAKALLIRHADIEDPAVGRMLECIERVQKETK